MKISKICSSMLVVSIATATMAHGIAKYQYLDSNTPVYFNDSSSKKIEDIKLFNSLYSHQTNDSNVNNQWDINDRWFEGELFYENSELTINMNIARPKKWWDEREIPVNSFNKTISITDYNIFGDNHSREVTIIKTLPVRNMHFWSKVISKTTGIVISKITATFKEDFSVENISTYIHINSNKGIRAFPFLHLLFNDSKKLTLDMLFQDKRMQKSPELIDDYKNQFVQIEVYPSNNYYITHTFQGGDYVSYTTDIKTDNLQSRHRKSVRITALQQNLSIDVENPSYNHAKSPTNTSPNRISNNKKLADASNELNCIFSKSGSFSSNSTSTNTSPNKTRSSSGYTSFDSTFTNTSPNEISVQNNYNTNDKTNSLFKFFKKKKS